MPTLLTESPSETVDPNFVSTDATSNQRKAGSVAGRAIKQIEQHPLFRGRASLLEITFDEGTLTIEGRLPTFYLKQVLQEALRDLDGIEQINNRVNVN